MSRVFANDQEDQSSTPGRVIPKTQKMVLDTALLNTQHYEVQIKGKVDQSTEWSRAFDVVAIEKGANFNFLLFETPVLPLILYFSSLSLSLSFTLFLSFSLFLFFFSLSLFLSLSLSFCSVSYIMYCLKLRFFSPLILSHSFFSLFPSLFLSLSFSFSLSTTALSLSFFLSVSVRYYASRK